RDAFLEERVRADREWRLAARQRFDRLAALSRRQRSRKPRDFDADITEPSLELAQMLLGEDLGRRHERDLPAALDRLQRGERGDDRLAGADVALQQPLHRHRALEVVGDLAPDALLRAR